MIVARVHPNTKHLLQPIKEFCVSHSIKLNFCMQHHLSVGKQARRIWRNFVRKLIARYLFIFIFDEIIY